MQTTRHMVVVDPYGSGGFIAPAFRDAGVPTVAVITGSEPPEGLAKTWHPGDFAEIIRADGPVGPLADRLSTLAPLGVVAGLETGVPLADELARRLCPDTGNDPATSYRRRDKWAMQQALAEAGLPHLRGLATDSAADVRSWVAEQCLENTPVVVKPPSSAGTDAVRKVRSGADLDGAVAALLGRTNALGMTDAKVLVQEHAEGVEYTVDTFTVAGVHHLCAVTRYGKHEHGDAIGIYDSVEFVDTDDPVCGPLISYVRHTLDVLGFAFGSAHTEVMLRPEGPVLIEVNPRMAGGQMVTMTRRITGTSQLDRLIDYLVHGRRPSTAGYRLKQHLMSVFLSAPHAGTVRNAEVLAPLDELPSLLHHDVQLFNGQRVEATRDLYTPLGRVVLTHPDRTQVDGDHRRVREMERQLRILEEAR